MKKNKNIFILLIIMTAFICFASNEVGENQKTENNKNKTLKQNNIKDKQLSITNNSLDQTYTATTNIKKSKFVKGIYLTAYKVASDDFHRILDLADSAGINTVVFDLKNMNGDIFFRTAQKSPLAGDNVRPVLDVKKVVKTLHGRNMRAVSRVVMFHDQWNAQRDSLLRPAKADGSAWRESEKRKPSWLDSSNRIVQNYLLSLIEEIAQQGVDEIQMDYIRFPTQGKISQAIFDFQEEDSLLFVQDSTYAFRNKTDVIADFIARAKRICSYYNVNLTADVFAIVAWQRNADIMATGQDMKRMSNYLDAIHPMIYSSHFAENFGYRQNVYNEPYFIMYKGTDLTLKSTLNQCKVIPYIQANSWRVNYKKEYIISQIEAIEDLNADGYILWNASNRYQKTLSWIRNYYESE